MRTVAKSPGDCFASWGLAKCGGPGGKPGPCAGAANDASVAAHNFASTPTSRAALSASKQATASDRPGVAAGSSKLAAIYHRKAAAEHSKQAKGPGADFHKTAAKLHLDAAAAHDAFVKESTQKPAGRLPTKLDIDDAGQALAAKGHKLGTAVPWKPGNKETSYNVQHATEGHKVMTVSEIKKLAGAK